MNLEKLKVSFRTSCLYRLRKLTTPFRSSRSQSKHQHGSLPKVAELFVIALSEQGVAKSHDNDVFVFDSSSAILKMERREDEPNSTAHEQRFFRRACDVGILSQSQFSSSNPRTTGRGIRCEEHSSFIVSWNLIGQRETKVITSQKSFPGSGSQTLFSAETSDSRKHVLRSQARDR